MAGTSELVIATCPCCLFCKRVPTLVVDGGTRNTEAKLSNNFLDQFIKHVSD